MHLLLQANAHAQITIHPFAGAGFGMENRVGFRGLTAIGGAAFPINDHLSGIGQAEFFISNKVSRNGLVESQGVFYRQFTASARLQYSAGSETGTGLLLEAGIGVRGGGTRHLDYSNFHEGISSNPVYTRGKVRGNGFILGIGYGFRISESLLGRVELTDQAFLRLNDLYALTFSVSF